MQIVTSILIISATIVVSAFAVLILFIIGLFIYDEIKSRKE